FTRNDSCIAAFRDSLCGTDWLVCTVEHRRSIAERKDQKTYDVRPKRAASSSSKASNSFNVETCSSRSSSPPCCLLAASRNQPKIFIRHPGKSGAPDLLGTIRHRFVTRFLAAKELGQVAPDRVGGAGELQGEP